MYNYYLGLDLGQAADYSALAVIEEPIYVPESGWLSAADLTPQQAEWYAAAGHRWRDQAPTKPPLWLRTLYRYPLRTPYPAVVEDIIRRLGGRDTYRGDAVLIVDGTGVGRAVVDMFRYASLPCAMDNIVITGGVKAERSHVPKRDLIGAVQAVLQTERLQVARHSEQTETWQQEMQNYAIKLTDTGHDTYNARGDSKHDDLVLAVALACWYRWRWNMGE